MKFLLFLEKLKTIIMKKRLLFGAMLMGAFFTAQAQDNCANALPISVGTTTVGTVNGVYPEEGCWAAGSAAPNAEWYVFTATETRLVRVNTDLEANDPAEVDTRISIYVGECDALQCYNGSDDVDPAQTGGNYLTNFTFAAVAGQTYYIVFDDRWADSGFQVEVSLDAEPNCATTAPLTEDWSNPANFEYCWGVASLDETADAVAWAYNDINDLNGDDVADPALMIFPDTTGAEVSKNDLAFTGALMMAAGEDYTVSVTYNGISFSTFIADENLQIVMFDSEGEIAATLATINNIEMTGTIADNMQNAVTSTTTFTPETDGQYQLGLISTSEGTTGVLVVYEVEITGLAGTDSPVASQLSVFPNPANNVINVTNADNILVNGITIADLNGRTVKTVKFDGVSEAQVNVSDLASGIYMMTISSDKGTTTKKIVKN
jgi:hypothetical protein